MKPETLITKHGQLSCTRCWQKSDESVQGLSGGRLVRDPGHWGAADPQLLILGISKGNTQAAAYNTDAFEDVAFKGARDRMLDVLQSVGLLRDETSERFNRRFTAAETEVAFASLIRCSLSAWNDKKQKFVADSPDILRLLKPGGAAWPVAQTCIDQHLVQLPERTRLVILLGNTPAYVKAMTRLLSAARGPLTAINEIAYDSNGVRFVHVTHPSKMNGHFGFFIRGENTAGRKRDLARDAITPFHNLVLSS